MTTKNQKKRSKKRSALLDIINGLLSFVVLAVLGAAGVFLWAAQSFYAEGGHKAEMTFQVERGSGLATVAEKLEAQSLVANKWIFRAGTIALKKERSIKAGEYRLTAGASMAEILTELTEGTPITYSVTIPEGFTSWQVLDRVNATEILEGEITQIPAEGSLLPDTYVFERGDSRQDVIDRMQEAQTKLLAEIWETRAADLPIKTPQELVTLASVVEKETGVAGERPQVAAVFVNRLKRGMRLQSDPTIIYGITKGEGKLGRGIRKSEIEEKTPYNTYQIDGLPIGPIANPGIDALKAAANPAISEDLYFVAAGPVPSDGHLFAKSYAEHRKNVAKYRAIEKAAAAEAAAEAEKAREELEAAAAAAAGEPLAE
jgi:UPF0755 protein